MHFITPLVMMIVCFVAACKERSQSSGVFHESTNLDSESAYFGDPTRMVTYCVALSPTFGLTEERFDELLKESLDAWKDYLAARTWGNQSKVLKINSFRYQKGPCANADLLFILGQFENPVAKSIACGHQAPGAAFKIENKIAERWSRATIWLSNELTLKEDLQTHCAQSMLSEIPDHFPDWNAMDNLPFKAVLMHELGHVLGFRHVEGTLMSENISRFVKDPADHKLELSNIDWQRVLLSFENRDNLSRDLPVETEAAREALFRKVAGYGPGGKLTSRLSIKDGIFSLALISPGEEVWLPFKPAGYSNEGLNAFSFQFRMAEGPVVWPIVADAPWDVGPIEGHYLTLAINTQQRQRARIDGTDVIVTLSTNPSNIETSYYVFYEDPETFDEIPLFIAKTLRETAPQ
ncbi:MAG: hypothetical protein AB7T49_03970 [Oligoflexales bacterium]